MLMLRKNHEQIVASLIRSHQNRIEGIKQADDVLMAGWQKRTEAAELQAKHLKQEAIALQNEIDKLRGQLVARAHKAKKPSKTEEVQ